MVDVFHAPSFNLVDVIEDAEQLERWAADTPEEDQDDYLIMTYNHESETDPYDEIMTIKEWNELGQDISK